MYMSICMWFSRHTCIQVCAHAYSQELSLTHAHMCTSTWGFRSSFILALAIFQDCTDMLLFLNCRLCMVDYVCVCTCVYFVLGGVYYICVYSYSICVYMQ